jgi:general secretion pathway protein C
VFLGSLLIVEIIVTARNLYSASRIDLSSVASQPVARPTSRRFNPRKIANAHLFGEEPSQLAAGDQSSAQQTQLPLALNGIIATRNPKHGFAILGEQGGPTHLYKTGATLGSANRMLYEVWVDRVLLQIDGHLEILKLPHSAGAGSTSALGAVQGEDPATVQMAQIEPQKSAGPPTAAESWFGNLNAEPEHVNGQLTGLLLRPAERFQRKFGLRNGDLLMAVNGTEVTDQERLADLLKASPDTVSMTVIRNGVQQTVRMPVNE